MDQPIMAELFRNALVDTLERGLVLKNIHQEGREILNKHSAFSIVGIRGAKILLIYIFVSIT
jgi:hypothetical protein